MFAYIKGSLEQKSNNYDRFSKQYRRTRWQRR